jgi:hypothetical protein
LLYVYIVGGICGAVFFLLAFNFLPFFQEQQRVFSTIDFGASAATMAIFIATATYIPNFKVKLFFVLETKLKYLALVLIFLSLINVDKANAGGNIAHIGGAFFGYLFSRSLLSKNSSNQNNNSSFFKQFIDFFKPKPKVVYTNYHSKVKNDDLYNTIKKQNQEVIDGILDKISKSGYESLSKEEKDILFKASKN